MENVGSADAAPIGTALRLVSPPRSLWELSPKDQQTSCYGSLTASTSSICAPTVVHRHKLFSTPAYEKLPKSDSGNFMEAPKFHYDMDFDLRALKEALKSAEFLEESGYQSILERSQHNQYGTGWIINQDMSDVSSDTDDNWDGFMDVGNKRVKIKEMSDILASRFAFMTGARTKEGNPVLIFPDSRSQVAEEELHLLVSYLLQVPPLEEEQKSYVIIIDRRMDKWSSVRLLLSYLTSAFPRPVRIVFVLKPESVLQRALEVGYRGISDNCKFKVVICQSSLELRRYIGPDCLTMDVGGALKYNHLEWVQHRMDIERMKSSATVIAQSLSEFGRCLKETELPNDVETTARILEIQTAERDAIKEDFRISIRKGLSLLRHVRQLDVKPEHEQLSPTRLHNVTAIERMLIQLEETERSFDTFWLKHEKRLTQCLKLRRFEDSFRKFQSAFAKHMIHLEEHREVGDGPAKAEQLAEAHAEYCQQAMEDVSGARLLRDTGQELISSQDVELTASLLPKCDELDRMADALSGALERRSEVLRLSKDMHQQIHAANNWCHRGVELLTTIPYDCTPSSAANALTTVDKYIEEGKSLKLDTFNNEPDLNKLIMLTTTETSTLLAQVAERIDDMRRLSISRRSALQKMAIREIRKPPVQVVSPEKLPQNNSDKRCSISDKKNLTPTSPTKRQIEVLHDGRDNAFTYGKGVENINSDSNPSIGSDRPTSILNFAISELINTEQSYVRELQSVVDFYIRPFEAPENEHLIAAHLKDRTDILFGNVPDLLNFHNNYLLADFLAAGNSVTEICRCFLSHRNKFLQLYHRYCQNKPLGETLRREQPDGAIAKFFTECQKRAGHPLPLSAYLLKPVQRITKYQLLLKEIHRHCGEQLRPHVDEALSSMLDLLAQLNTAMHQLHIAGFVGDLTQMGPLRLQNECDIYAFKKRTRRLNKAQRRHLFLFDGGLLFCKKRSQSLPYASEYYEHKLSIPTCSLGFSETSKTSSARFEVWDETKNEAYVVQTIDESARIKWIQRLYRIVGERVTHRDRLGQQHRPARPQSWASTISTDSIRSTDTATDSSAVDGNGNNHGGTCCSSPSSGSPTFVPVTSDEDPDNNVDTTDQLQTRSYSCPENSLEALSALTSATVPSLITSSPVSTKIATTLPPLSVSSSSPLSTTTTTTAVATASLNTIVESSSSTELFASI